MSDGGMEAFPAGSSVGSCTGGAFSWASANYSSLLCQRYVYSLSHGLILSGCRVHVCVRARMFTIARVPCCVVVDVTPAVSNRKQYRAITALSIPPV